MHVEITVALNEDECRFAVRHLVPDTATAVGVVIHANVGGNNTLQGIVSLQYLGRKKDGTVHKRRTGQGWNLNEDWWRVLVKNNHRLPVPLRLAADDLVSTRSKTTKTGA